MYAGVITVLDSARLKRLLAASTANGRRQFEGGVEWSSAKPGRACHVRTEARRCARLPMCMFLSLHPQLLKQALLTMSP